MNAVDPDADKTADAPNETPPGGQPARTMFVAACVAVVLLGYAWSPYNGASWHAVAGANALLVLALPELLPAPRARRRCSIMAAFVTVVIGVQHAVHDDSSADIHVGWGLGLCTWLAGLHAMLWLDAAAD